MGKTIAIAVQRGLLPLMVSMAAVLCPSYPADAANPPQETSAPAPIARVVGRSPQDSSEPRLYLQVGAFLDDANARRLQQRLQSEAIDNVVLRGGGTSDRTMHQVRIGPIARFDEYRGLVAKLREQDLDNTHLVAELSEAPQTEYLQRLDASLDFFATVRANQPRVSLYLQVGAFVEKKNAERLTQLLQAEGFSNVVIRDGKTGDWPIYRVRLGPVTDVDELDALITSLRNLDIDDSYLVAELSSASPVAGPPDSAFRAGTVQRDVVELDATPEPGYLEKPAVALQSPGGNEQSKPIDVIDLDVLRVAGFAEQPAPALSGQDPDQYIDQYMADGDGSDEWYEDQTAQRAGRQYIGAEFVYYQNSSDVLGDATEMGLRTNWRQETRNFGDLDAEFIFSDIDIDYIGRNQTNSDVMFTLRQTGAPVADHWTMNNTIGFQRTLISSLMNGGYRVRLPTSPLFGLSGQLINSNKDFMWFTGNTGYYEGTALRQFQEDGGKLIGGAYQHEITPMFWLGGEVVNFTGNDFVREHSSVLAAGQYARPDRTMEYDFHMLADDDSNLGLWVDGMQFLAGNYQLRYGAFYLQPDLAWMDRPIANNQTGLYVRADKQAFLYTLSAGYDYMETGLDTSNFLPSTRTHSTFFNGNYRVNRKLTLGLNANLGLRSIDSVQNEDQTFWRLSNFLFYQFPIGTSRLELYASGLSSEINSNDDGRQGVRLSHDWRMPQSLRLTTEVRLEETQRLGQDRNYREASVQFRQDIGNNWTWGVNASTYQDVGDQDSYDGVGLNADARWDFLPNWYASMSVLYNANVIDLENTQLNEFEDNPKSNSVWLSIGYGRSSGQPLMSLGQNNGRAGSGRVSGVVFYDENQDFIRQPGEKPAAGILVLLDGRYEVMTDSEGRYTFDPVHTGVHRVSLVTEDLPLPWGMHDETPRRVEVSLRRTGEADFPLVRIN
jgi:cell division protein FtsN